MTASSSGEPLAEGTHRLSKAHQTFQLVEIVHSVRRIVRLWSLKLVSLIEKQSAT